MEVTDNREANAIKRLLLTSPKRRGHAMPHKATWDIPGVGQERGRVRRKPKPQPTLGKARQGRQTA